MIGLARVLGVAALCAGFSLLSQPASVAAATASPERAGSAAAEHRWGPGMPRLKRARGCVPRPGARCAGADLRAVQLFDRSLRGIDLRRARLGGANLVGADLRGADLRRADLTPGRAAPGKGRHRARGVPRLPAVLLRADLRKADLAGARLNRAQLSGARLLGARLKRARLRRAELAHADLRGADLRRADLRGADLRRAMLTNADLRGADLRGATLAAADLRGTRLDRANLVRTTLAGALVSRRQLSSAARVCLTIAPHGRALDRDCRRLRIKTRRLRAPRLARTLAEGAGRHRKATIPIGPRLAQSPGRRTARRGAEARASRGCSPGANADCEGFYLASTSFPGVEVPQSNFYRTDFDWANLEGADFEGSFLALAQFNGANLKGANLARTTPGLQPSTDTAINFNYADLEGADLEGADLHGAQFTSANLRNANLNGTDLTQANFYEADLSGASLEGALVEATQFTRADLREANLFGSFIYGASFSQANLEGALLGLYLAGAPGGGFSGQEGSLNLDQAGWTCGTVLPNGTISNSDCQFLFQLLAELLAGIADSVAGLEFGVVSNSVISSAVRAALEDSTESVGGTALRLVNWALFEGSVDALREIVADSPTIGTALTEIVPVVKQMTIAAGKVGWEIEAPAVKTQLQSVWEFLSRATAGGRAQPGPEHAYVYSPIQEWSEEWQENLYHWWGSKPEGDEYAAAVDCPRFTPEPLNPNYEISVCEQTGQPVVPPDPPTVTRSTRADG